VLIEMGHNDEGDPTKNDKYSERGTLPGLSNGTKLIQTSKGKETVHTFGFYLRTMIHDVQQKSAIPIISGMVPRNYWSKNNKTVQEKWPFDDFAREQAKESGVAFLDHTKYSVMMLQGLGFEKAEKLFPQDRTHTNDEGAKLNAETFVMAIKCGESVLGKWLSDKGKAIRASC
jgi:rhamnogalacturonan acetylesterase